MISSLPLLCRKLLRLFKFVKNYFNSIFCRYHVRLETSAVVETPLEGKGFEQPELASSKSDELADQPLVGAEERRFTTVKLVTVFSTTISFTPTAITSTKTVAGDAGLNCLPNGYVVCAA